MAKAPPRKERTDATDGLLLFFRGFLALPVAFAMPYAHAWFGKPHPSGGLNAIGLFFGLFEMGVISALVYFLVGSAFHYFLRFRDWNLTLRVDLALALIFVVLLAVGGLSVRYVDVKPTEPTAPTPTSQLVPYAAATDRTGSDLDPK